MHEKLLGLLRMQHEITDEKSNEKSIPVVMMSDSQIMSAVRMTL
jgi:hypothetical protein